MNMEKAAWSSNQVLDNQTRYGHNEVMKKAKVSELKARLSAYLAEVRSGGSVIVCDRRTPIAQLIPFDDRTDDLKIQEASRPVSELSKVQAIGLRKRVDIGRILREARGGR